MKYLLIAFFMFSFSCFAQEEEKKGTIKVKKTEVDTLNVIVIENTTVIEPVLATSELVAVEQMPEYPGGNSAMQKYINSSTIYPNSAIDAGISGTSYITFVINIDGTISDVKLLRGIKGCPECDKEAIRVISLMPNFKPGYQNGKAVRVQYSLPVKFELK